MNYLGGSDHEDLLEELGSFACRPRAFVYWAFPWGEQGSELERRAGPEAWQDDVLSYIEGKLIAGLSNLLEVIAEAIQIAVKSGHDIGKSAFVCWIIIWAISTREDTKGVVTANTEKQLRLKLWAELAKWHRLFIAKSLFKVTATSIQASDPDREKEWRIDAIPWSEDNPEAFAGLHNFGKRVLVIFDEASAIVNKIWETIDGVMNEAETELIWIATGNPTRNTGRFRECFEAKGQGQFWKPFTVDSRAVSFTNKERIEAQINLWGIDSDFIKVRWLGDFPSAGSNQLIDSETIRAAMAKGAESTPWEPLILGLDVARFGDNESVARFRRGRDGKTIPPYRWRGLSTTALGHEVVSLINRYAPDAVFVDEGGIGGGVIDFIRFLGYTCIGVNFGGSASYVLTGELAYNKRAEMYLNLRHWLQTGGAIEDNEKLSTQLASIEYGFGKGKVNHGAILLTPKEEMDESPDDADALALTFAFPVAQALAPGLAQTKVEYDPLSYEAFTGKPAQREYPDLSRMQH